MMGRQTWVMCGLLLFGGWVTVTVAEKDHGASVSSNAEKNSKAENAHAGIANSGTALTESSPSETVSADRRAKKPGHRHAGRQPSKSSSRPRKTAKALTPAREAAALAFAKSHHPELAELLKRLKKRSKPAYRRAVRRLYLDSERMARIKERSSERYQLALETWQADSRIRLLAARIATSKRPSSKLESQLEEALQERIDLRIRHLEHDRRRLLQRVERIEQTTARLREDREKAARHYLQRIKRSLGLKNRNERINKRNKNRNKQRSPHATGTKRQRRADENKQSPRRKDTPSPRRK